PPPFPYTTLFRSQRGARHHQVAAVQVIPAPGRRSSVSAKGYPMPVKKSARKMPPPRVPILAEESLTAPQRALLESIRSGPRGSGTNSRGPFAVFLHAPAFGELDQLLGGHRPFTSAVP